MSDLTDAECKNAASRAKPYKKGAGKGLYLEIAPNGSKYWRFKYRFAGKEKRIALGVYPEISLKDARETRNTMRAFVKEGKDPMTIRKEERKAFIEKTATTFELVTREWYGYNKDKWSSNHAAQVIGRMEKDVFPEIGGRPITDIEPLEIFNMLKKMQSRGANELAKRTLQFCGHIFRYAVITKRAERDPTTDLKKVLRPAKHGHFAAIEADDISDFLHTLHRNDARLFSQTRRAVMLLMLTFVRTGELIGAKWEEINLEGRQWIIPAERMKMRRPHIVPLSEQACRILHEQHELSGRWEAGWVLPSLAHPRKHMSNMTILKALERLGYKGRMTGHGFRALAMSTIKEKLGYRHEVVDRQLAHAPKNQLAASYDRASFLPDRRKMMQEWADYLDLVFKSGEVIKVDFTTATKEVKSSTDHLSN